MRITVALCRISELPLRDSPLQKGRIGLDTGCRKDAAVVRTTRTRPVLVDRTTVVDEHRTMAPLVVAHHDVSGWQVRRRKQER